MRRQGGGVILNTVSVAAIRPRPNLLAYNSSKGAALVASKSMAIELAPDRIRVNAVCPGPATRRCWPRSSAAISEAHRAAFLSTIPLGRLCAPADVASAMVFLASDEASFVTGVVSSKSTAAAVSETVQTIRTQSSQNLAEKFEPDELCEPANVV